ncbi:TlpA family protein disulfide reductase [Burkholderia sp. Bp8963]|nr:TlpA family protein disulfide reductase [Burkholderia sp. Bp8963]
MTRSVGQATRARSRNGGEARCMAAGSGAGLFLDALFVGLIAARVGYVACWWPEYAAAPESIIALGDGGFYWWVGVPVAVGFAWWKSRRMPALRRPLLAGMAAGMLAWGAAQGGLALLQRTAPPLSALQLHAIDTAPVSMSRYTGKPVVVNLWATWCPPCRREMPILAQAQADYPGVTFVMVNQGENAPTVQAFLAQQGLTFGHVLLDPSLSAMHLFGSRGLPTTLFFDANGKLVESHMGEITAARLKDTMKNHSSP